ncbi:hypothetical protein ARMGADRAFT_1022031 [Armillaria gallica]|uniref:Uncharacterized protein n=1 Tax=Armillaria gallica TaxID=47427 RepID=A0A2H3E7A3_ARMGA|nr:hypothetical protein ARMGADRAFT_1022031 [Armillaria gallica]
MSQDGPAPPPVHYQYPQVTPSAVPNASTQVLFVPYPSVSLAPPPTGSTGSVGAAQLPQLVPQAPGTFNTSNPQPPIADDGTILKTGQMGIRMYGVIVKVTNHSDGTKQNRCHHAGIYAEYRVCLGAIKCSSCERLICSKTNSSARIRNAQLNGRPTIIPPRKKENSGASGSTSGPILMATFLEVVTAPRKRYKLMSK